MSTKTLRTFVTVLIVMTIALSASFISTKPNELLPRRIDTVKIINNNPEPILIEELNDHGMPTGTGLRQYMRGDTLVTIKYDQYTSCNQCNPYNSHNPCNLYNQSNSRNPHTSHNETWPSPKDWLPYGDYIQEITYTRDSR